MSKQACTDIPHGTINRWDMILAAGEKPLRLKTAAKADEERYGKAKRCYDLADEVDDLWLLESLSRAPQLSNS